jgi:rhodanese-related sulfurtransferase
MLKFLKSLFDDDTSISEPGLLDGAVILDVRPPSEYRQEHLRGSKNIPISEIKSMLETIRKWNKPVITVCRSGVRSAVARSVLVAAGIEAYNGGPWTNLRN